METNQTYNPKPQPRSLVSMILDFVLGRKYYANITYTRGSNAQGLAYYIFPTRAMAQEHARALASNASYGFTETISFRSRQKY